MANRFNFGNKWSWEVNDLLQKSNAKVGDIVENVGYISDCDTHNYKSAVIENIRKYNYYPGGNPDECVIKWRIFYKFED